jgi:hypothetical protein
MHSFRIRIILIIVIVSVTFSANTNSQMSENVYNNCYQQINDGFVHNSQPMKALLTGAEVAEFKTTLFEGNIYRIATCSPDQKKIWFSVYDTNNQLLFSSSQNNNSSSWDFKMEGNLECVIEAGLMPGSGDSGLALLLIGFKNIEATN